MFRTLRTSAATAKKKNETKKGGNYYYCILSKQSQIKIIFFFHEKKNYFKQSIKKEISNLVTQFGGTKNFLFFIIKKTFSYYIRVLLL